MALPVPNRPVEEAAIAGNIVERIVSRYVPRRFANDDSQLAFEIQLLGYERTNDGFIRPYQAAREARENNRVVGDLAPHLFDVWPVVDTDAEYSLVCCLTLP